MTDVSINFLAVILCAVVAMVLGSVWYSPKMLFGKQWMALMGKSEAELKSGMKPSTYPLMAVSALVMAWVLAYFVDYAGAGTAMQGAMVGFWAWLGFVVTSGAGQVLFEMKPKKLYYINMGYYLVQLLIMGAILAAW